MRAASNQRRPAVRESTITTQPESARLLAGLRPEQMAFLGEYTGATQDKQVFVQLLCWPTVPAAWGMLAQSCTALRNLRGDPAALSPPKSASWIHQVAPQLSRPLERDAAAAESTLATLIRRLPIRFAASVVEVGANQPPGPETLRYRNLYSESLGAYSAHLNAANLAACRTLIAPEQAPSITEIQRQVYDEVLPHLDGAARVKGMTLTIWPGTDVPPPLEMVQLAASAVGRHLHEPLVASPLFETVRGLLVPSSRFHSHSSSGRRR